MSLLHDMELADTLEAERMRRGIKPLRNLAPVAPLEVPAAGERAYRCGWCGSRSRKCHADLNGLLARHYEGRL